MFLQLPAEGRDVKQDSDNVFVSGQPGTSNGSHPPSHTLLLDLTV